VFACLLPFLFREKRIHDLPLKHHQAVRVAANIRVHRHGIHETFIVLAVEELESVHPHFFDVARIHPAMAVRCWKSPSAPEITRYRERRWTHLTFLDKHHRRQVIRIPTGRDLTQARGGSGFEGLHPVVWVLLVVDGDPFVACA